MVTASPRQPESTLISDVKVALFNGKSHTMSDLDVLRYVVDNGQDSLNAKVLANDTLLKRYGTPRKLKKAVDEMLTTKREEIRHLSASREFGKKVEKQGWGKWALEKAKSVVLFPVRHPIWTALIILAVIGASYYTAGGLSQALAKLHGLVSDSVIARLKGLDGAAGALAPGMGPGMELPGGGMSSPGIGAEGFAPALPPSPMPPPIPPPGPVA